MVDRRRIVWSWISAYVSSRYLDKSPSPCRTTCRYSMLKDPPVYIQLLQDSHGVCPRSIAIICRNMPLKTSWTEIRHCTLRVLVCPGGFGGTQNRDPMLLLECTIIRAPRGVPKPDPRPKSPKRAIIYLIVHPFRQGRGGPLRSETIPLPNLDVVPFDYKPIHVRLALF